MHPRQQDQVRNILAAKAAGQTKKSQGQPREPRATGHRPRKIKEIADKRKKVKKYTGGRIPKNLFFPVPHRDCKNISLRIAFNTYPKTWNPA